MQSRSWPEVMADERRPAVVIVRLDRFHMPPELLLSLIDACQERFLDAAMQTVLLLALPSVPEGFSTETEKFLVAWMAGILQVFRLCKIEARPMPLGMYEPTATVDLPAGLGTIGELRLTWPQIIASAGVICEEWVTCDQPPHQPTQWEKTESQQFCLLSRTWRICWATPSAGAPHVCSVFPHGSIRGHPHTQSGDQSPPPTPT